ncbi:hypothetical protein I7I53_05658 [Histoplasma capsulatum var. duboisii H88]|uniref:Uncharacterized protein n=1 Tax=Ajellomyces capsulatus (strain H88) TaxID=544711 RepID=A0A8A1LTI0_AJEC8|nr:hypothetical protein I7I53_05658 [Histoplasma capsulatum var. duboisii H88]
MKAYSLTGCASAPSTLILVYSGYSVFIRIIELHAGSRTDRERKNIYYVLNKRTSIFYRQMNKMVWNSPDCR